MVRLQESKGEFSLCVPKQLVKVKGWAKGEELLLTFNERGNVEIRETPSQKPSGA